MQRLNNENSGAVSNGTSRDSGRLRPMQALVFREYLTMTVKRITSTPAFLVALTLTASCALAGPQTKLSLDPSVTVRL